MLRDDIDARSGFLMTLTWLLAVMERYPSPLEFVLVHIAFGNKNELGEAYGAQEAVNQLANVTRSLKKTFRKADMIARNGTDFWIIVPYTPATEKIYDKVLGIFHDAKHDDLKIVDRDTTIFSLAMLIEKKVHAKMNVVEFLDHLKLHRPEYAIHSFRFPSSNNQ